MGPYTMGALAHEFQLRPDITFLNHGSFGACPRPVFAAYHEWQRLLEADPVDFIGRKLRGHLADARARLATFLGAQANDLVFVPNATFGMNIVARSLAFERGDEVLTTDHEYGAVDRTWRYLCERQGAQLVIQPIDLPLHSIDAIVEQLWQRVTPRTRVISLSHITSPTALVFPVAEICARARDAGILTIIDGAHAPGQINLDLTAIGADFYVGNCHKWLCAPKGAGFLHARTERQKLLEPLIVGWGWQAITPGPSLFLDYFEQLGTNDLSAYLSVPAAIDFLAANDWPAVQASCQALLTATHERLTAITGMPPISAGAPDWWTQMCSIPLPNTTDPVIGQRLWQEHQIEVPIVPWQGRIFVRVSSQAYNTPADMDHLVTALEQVLTTTLKPTIT